MYYRRATEQPSRELTLSRRSSLNGFMRVYCSVIVCSNNSLVERVRHSIPSSSASLQPAHLSNPALFTPSHLFPDGHLLRKARCDSRPKSMPRTSRRWKAHGSRRGEISRPYQGNQVQIASPLNDDDVLRVGIKRKRRKREEEQGGDARLLIIIQGGVNGPRAHE